MKLNEGQDILVKVKVIRQAEDYRPDRDKGYEVQTSRGSRAYIDPDDIFVCLKDNAEEKED